MSGFLAVATVTAALQKLLGDAVAADVPGGKVTTERPDKAAPTLPTANLYLYQVIPDPSARNLDLPTRRSDGSPVVRARAAIDLHYLISFYGKDAELEPQRLLGSVVRRLNARPLITRELIAAVITDAGEHPPIHEWIATTDLGEADDLVRICPLPLNLEELSKLWSVFFQTPYTLSTAWSASVVLLEEEGPQRSAPPPAAAALSVRPLSRPLITRIEVAGDPTAPITGDAILRVTGSGLRGDTTAVRVGGAELPIPPEAAGDVALEVDLSIASPGMLRAGRVAVLVVERQLVGTPPQPRGEVISAPFTVTLRPHATKASVAADGVTVTTDLTVGAHQRVVLQLLDPDTGDILRLLDGPERSVDATSVTVPVTGVPAGSYRAQLLVDGAATIETPAVSLP
jgi:hypothetical protein